MIKFTGLYFADDYVQGLEIVGNLAYLADGEVGLDLVDISDPNNPILLGNYDTDGKANKVDIVDNIAYVASGTGGLQIIDVSDPQNPTLLGSNPLTVSSSSEGQGVEVVGDTAFVAGNAAGLDIVDVSDPTNPTILSNIKVGLSDQNIGGIIIQGYSSAQNINIKGNTAFVSHLHGMDIIDISNVNNPVLLGNYNIDNWTRDIAIVDNTAFLATYQHGLEIVDISNLNNPTLIGNYDIDNVKGVEVKDNKAFLTGLYNGLTVLDISDPTKPILLDDYLWFYNDGGKDVQIVDNTAYVASDWGYLEILDISNPVDTTLLSNYNTEEAVFTAVSGNLAFVVNADQSDFFGDIKTQGYLEMVDISDPNKPVFVSNFESLGDPFSVTIRDNTAFIADREGGLTIVDISNAQNPTLLSNYDTPGKVWQVELSENTAFIADDTGGIQILDISDLTKPTLISNFAGADFANNIQVVGNTAFIANGDFLNQVEGQLLIVDISDLSNPSLLSSYDLNGLAYQVDINNDIAYVTNGGTGVEIIDVSDLTKPTLLSNYQPYDPMDVDSYFLYAGTVKIVADKMFVAYGGGGVHVVDISDPSSPEQLGTYENMPAAVEIAVTDNKAFVSTMDSGLRILDVSEYLTTTNNPPIINQEIPDQSSIINTEFTYTIPENSFSDADGQVLTYTVANLPTWLTFDANTRTFLGTSTELGNLAITVTVSDGKDNVSDTFKLDIKSEEIKPIFEPISIDENLFTGAGDNIINNTSSNSNRVYSGLGNDTILAQENDRIFAGEGDDLLDASQGKGGNRLFAGAGNDTLIAGDGNDLLVGGEGADKFTVADTNLPTNYNLILDFETGDQVVIKNLNVTFADITISNGTKGAELKIPSLGQEAMAIFPNLDANTLNNANNFEIS